MIYLYFAVLILSFVILFKSANLFVTGACSISDIYNIPRLITGIIFVGIATTAPEFGVSVISSFLGHEEFALGNAIGSVIADDGIALGLAGVLAPAAILVSCKTLKIAGAFLLTIDFLAYFLARNGTIGRLEGLFFIFLLIFYFILLYKTRLFKNSLPEEESDIYIDQESCSRFKLIKKPLFLFLGGIIGVIVASRLVVISAVKISEYFSVPEFIIGSIVIAMGTSLPEISTCITAARKGEGELAVGNIIGADVLNILWIIGVSALVKPLSLELRVINFAFPYMILIVIVMLVSLRLRCRLTKAKGVILILMYIVFLVISFLFYT